MSNKRITPKYKIARRLGENLWGRDKCPTNTRTSGPGMHGARRGRLTDYGVQFREKQKLKGYYGSISEKQFVSIYKDAAKKKGDKSENLIKLLESRLDAIVYRLNFAPTVFSARQIINHKHILVNGKTVNIASYRCKVGDVIEVKESAQKFAIIAEAVEKTERDVPEYITADKFKGTFNRLPEFDEVPYPVQMNPHLIIEFYSR